MFAHYSFLSFLALVFLGTGIATSTVVLFTLSKAEGMLKKGAEFVPFYFFAGGALAKYLS